MADWIVWYSNDRYETYHLFFDCVSRNRIYGQHLRIAMLQEMRITDLQLCDHCADLLSDGEGGQYICGDIIGVNLR